MGRGKHGLFNGLAALPWQAGIGIGVLGYLLIGHGVPLLLARRSGVLAQAFAVQSNLTGMLAFAFLAMCVLASLISWLRRRHRRRLLDTRIGLDSVARLGWREFELLVGEAFRREGHAVEETGLGGADGGIDLILRRGGKRILVQCKHWRRERVPVNVVREMYGLLAHHQADAVRIAALGGFTRDAARFASGKPIDLIDGRALLEMIRKVQVGTGAAPAAKSHCWRSGA